MNKGLIVNIIKNTFNKNKLYVLFLLLVIVVSSRGWAIANKIELDTEEVVNNESSEVEPPTDYLINQLVLNEIGEDNFPLKNIDALNQKLQEYNAELKKRGKPLIYFGLANNYELINVPFFQDKYNIAEATPNSIREGYSQSLFSNSETNNLGSGFEELRKVYEEDYVSKKERLFTEGMSGVEEDAILITKYYYGLVKEGTDLNEQTANIQWLSAISHMLSKSLDGNLEIDQTKLKAHYKSLKGLQVDPNLRLLEAWYNYLTDRELPDTSGMLTANSNGSNIDDSTACTELTSDEAIIKREALIIAINGNDASKISTAVLYTCFDVVTSIGYANLITGIDKMVSNDLVVNNIEVAILRLIHALPSDNFGTFFKALKENDNALLDKLLSTIDNHSLNPFDGDNFTSLIEEFLRIGSANEGKYFKQERIYLLTTLLKSYDKNVTVGVRDAIKEVMTFNLEASEDTFEDFLTESNYENLIRVLKTQLENIPDNEGLVLIGERLGNFFSDKSNQSVYLYLLEQAFNTNAEVKIFDENTSLIMGLNMVSKMFEYLPEDSRAIYTYLEETEYKHIHDLLSVLHSGNNKPRCYNYESTVSSYYNGITELFSKYGDMDSRIELVKWAIDQEGAFNDFESFFTHIFQNIPISEDRKKVYEFLSFSQEGSIKDYYYFKKIIVDVLGGDERIIEFSKKYIEYVNEYGTVNDRLALINYAFDDFLDTLLFWRSDNANLLSILLDDLTAFDTEVIRNELAADNYVIFKRMWELLEDDADVKHFESFVAGFSNLFKFSKDQVDWQKSNYEKYLDENQGYLSTLPGNIKKIENNFIPMTSSGAFGGTNSYNDYVITSEIDRSISGKEIVLVKVEIEDEVILEKYFEPFEIVFVQFLEDTQVNDTLSYKKGDIIAIPAFYVAWMDGTISSHQFMTRLRVYGDVAVVVGMGFAIAGSGGAAIPIALAGGEIIFAFVDMSIALYEDELKQEFGDQAVDYLEVANIIWGIANLPSAIKTLPEGYVTLKALGGKVIKSGANAVKSTPDKITEIKIAYRLFKQNLPAILEDLNSADPVILDNLSFRLASVEAKFRGQYENLRNPTDAFKTFYETIRDAAAILHLRKAPSIASLIKDYPDKFEFNIANQLLEIKQKGTGTAFCKVSKDGVLSDIQFELIQRENISSSITINAKVLDESGNVSDEVFEIVVKNDGSIAFRRNKGSNDIDAFLNGTPANNNATRIVKMYPTMEFWTVDFSIGQENYKNIIESEEELNRIMLILKDLDNSVAVVKYKVLNEFDLQLGYIEFSSENSLSAADGGLIGEIGSDYEAIFHLEPNANIPDFTPTTLLTVVEAPNFGYTIPETFRLVDGIEDFANNTNVRIAMGGIQSKALQSRFPELNFEELSALRYISASIDEVESAFNSSNRVNGHYKAVGLFANSGIGKLPEYQGSRVFKEVKGALRDKIMNVSMGENVSFPSPLVASKSKKAILNSILKNSSSVFLEIENPKGADLGDISAFPNLQMVLFKPNSNFEVVDINSAIYNGREIAYIKLRYSSIDDGLPPSMLSTSDLVNFDRIIEGASSIELGGILIVVETQDDIFGQVRYLVEGESELNILLQRIGISTNNPPTIYKSRVLKPVSFNRGMKEINMLDPFEVIFDKNNGQKLNIDNWETYLRDLPDEIRTSDMYVVGKSDDLFSLPPASNSYDNVVTAFSLQPGQKLIMVITEDEIFGRVRYLVNTDNELSELLRGIDENSTTITELEVLQGISFEKGMTRVNQSNPFEGIIDTKNHNTVDNEIWDDYFKDVINNNGSDLPSLNDLSNLEKIVSGTSFVEAGYTLIIVETADEIFGRVRYLLNDVEEIMELSKVINLSEDSFPLFTELTVKRDITFERGILKINASNYYEGIFDATNNSLITNDNWDDYLMNRSVNRLYKSRLNTDEWQWSGATPEELESAVIGVASPNNTMKSRGGDTEPVQSSNIETLPPHEVIEINSTNNLQSITDLIDYKFGDYIYIVEHDDGTALGKMIYNFSSEGELEDLLSLLRNSSGPDAITKVAKYQVIEDVKAVETIKYNENGGPIQGIIPSDINSNAEISSVKWEDYLDEISTNEYKYGTNEAPLVTSTNSVGALVKSVPKGSTLYVLAFDDFGVSAGRFMQYFSSQADLDKQLVNIKTNTTETYSLIITEYEVLIDARIGISPIALDSNTEFLNTFPEIEFEVDGAIIVSKDPLGSVDMYDYLKRIKAYVPDGHGVKEMDTSTILPIPAGAYENYIPSEKYISLFGTERLDNFTDDIPFLRAMTEVHELGLVEKYKDLTIEELAAIRYYTFGGSDRLNPHLRGEGVSVSDYQIVFEAILNNALNKLTKTNISEVYKGRLSGQRAEIALTWNIGDAITIPDFVSTSMQMEVALGFNMKQKSKVMYIIQNPKGVEITEFAMNQQEREVLIGSKSNFEVVDILDNYDIGKGHKTRVITLQQID